MLIFSEILCRAVEGIPAWAQGVKTSVVIVCLSWVTQYCFPSAYLNRCQLLGL